MSTSSSSAASGDDIGVVSEIDGATSDKNRFDGWAVEEISFDDSAQTQSKTPQMKTESLSTDWPEWNVEDDNKQKKKKTKKLRVGQDEDEDLYEGIMESEEEDESTLTLPAPAVPTSPTHELEEYDSDEEEVEGDVPQYESVPPPPRQATTVQPGETKKPGCGETKPTLPPPLVEETEGDSDSDFEEEEDIVIQPTNPQSGGGGGGSSAGGAKVEPIPKESLPELANRGEESGQTQQSPPAESVESKDKQKNLQTAKDVQDIVEKNLNEKNKVVDSVKDAAALKRLQDALKEFHQYAATPNDKRAPTFKNAIFNAKSKDITVAHEKRIFLALKCLEKMSATGDKDSEKTRFTVAPVDLSTNKLTTELSHAFCSYVASQENVPSNNRRALAQAMIADVTKSSAIVSRTTLILAATIANMLLSEAAALKTASLVVSDAEKKKRYDTLRSAILVDVGKFIDAISATIPSEAATKKILQQISAMSEKFRSAALYLSPIACNQAGKSNESYATALAVLLRQFAEYGPAATEYNSNRDFSSLIVIQSNLIMPDLIMYPEAMYDVLAGMLVGVMGTFNVIESANDRKKIIDAWKSVKNTLAEQQSYLVSNTQKSETLISKAPVAAKPTLTATTTNTSTATAKTQTKEKTVRISEKKPVVSSAAPAVSHEEEYISRFAQVNADDDE